MLFRSVSELEQWFSTINLSEYNGLKLKEYEKILDVPKFVDSHLACLKTNKGKEIFLPYYERLIELKNIIETSSMRDV